MARRPQSEQQAAPKRELTPTQMKRCIERLDERIAELQAFDVRTIASTSSPELHGLETAIKDTLDRSFGEGSLVYRRFERAASLGYFPGFVSYGGVPVSDCQDGVAKNIKNAIALLQEAKRVLNEDLADSGAESDADASLANVPTELSRRVFIVHGHDEAARESVARFLEKIEFEPIILHEQASRNRTVMEKIEDNSEVGFAVVLLTPDDLGRGVSEPDLRPRARQNVLLELGYFIGRLGRDRVCALKRGDIEIPSDYLGVVWVSIDESGGWKQALGKELQAAGHEIDWNRVMRA
ncbi:TIR domain-containing protein [Burkholderia multivorans]|uniref:TIR domain-containing protein n=1 Tax=Burkholderia multivorans TaxID=87883 RepID=UPI0009BA40C1|nr:nucleotide-binding protein [Burkholderia multivorans]MCA8263601.1 nucleotide-binding protein [Burkholderia multivorans]MDN7886267.1 nucleotide-binding protein [Burkholderia multivorans]MDN7976589.1 nucleotide-binding protein [Burkholderia multivorans]MDN7982135.1 nucleotide-binding protein [Burkholderia multivorans]MDN7987798.1 nucleotide-binding protein [Burkholderia multivorans]